MLRPVIKLAAPLLLIIGSISGCSYFTEGVLIDEHRYAETTPKGSDVFGDFTNRVVYLDQNWDAQDSLWFYNTTQGSDWMPYETFLHLEQTDSEQLFRSPENMRRYRYLVQQASYANPDGLPLGFVKDTYQDQEYVGFTCAACHTTQVNYQGMGIRIDGGPALADMEGMLVAMEKALKNSLDDSDKFERLARKVLGDKYESGQQAFRKQLQKVYEDQAFYNFSNAPMHGTQWVPYGYSRLDAFGRIYNRVLSHLTPDDKKNYNPANAPVSYPFLWDTPHSDFVQWNGIGDNRDEGLAGVLGPLGRNTGEVLGVFASFNLDRDPSKIGYQSSANKFNLERLERHLQKLESPLWPEDILGEIDISKAQQGEQVYREYRCGWCHDGGESIIPPSPEFDRTADNRVMITQFATTPLLGEDENTTQDWIGTDRQMATNALVYKGKTGFFEGKVINLGKEPKFGPESLVVPALSKAAQGVILSPDYDKLPIRRWLEQGFLFLRTKMGNTLPPTKRHNDFQIVEKTPAMLKAYKARTLNGIWATAPYLHNGSVANLYELFQPACSDAEISQGKQCRANRFTIGSREFDPKHVGLVTKPADQYPDLFVFDTSLPSNSNLGHEYAAGNTPIIKLDDEGVPVRDGNGKFESFKLPPISDKQRWALVEYLKTL